MIEPDSAVVLTGVGAVTGDQVLPATRGLRLENVDPDCVFDHVVASPRHGRLRSVMVNAAGFGGQNAALLLRRGNAP